MRLANRSSGVIEQTYAAIRLALEGAGIDRSSSANNSLEWIRERVPDENINSRPLENLTSGAGQGGVSEAQAEELLRFRIESDCRAILPSVTAIAPSSTANVLLHLRPVRGRLHAAFSTQFGTDALVVVDDAINDLTMSLAKWMMGAWGSPREPESERDGPPGPPLPLADAVRCARIELGSMRWNGALWQPIRLDLPLAGWSFAELVATFARRFVLAHELAHISLGHTGGNESVATGDAHGDPQKELQADAFAARVMIDAMRRDGLDASNDDQAGGVACLAIRCALETIALTDDAFLVRSESHPSVAERRLVAFGEVGLPSSHGLEAPADYFFTAMSSTSTSTDLPMSSIVAAFDELSFAMEYSDETLAELDRIDHVEALFHVPLQSLLSGLGAIILEGEVDRLTPAVKIASERANALVQGEGGAAGLPASEWMRLAAGHFWLNEILLAECDADQLSETLSPPGGRRFCDWAVWVDDACPEGTVGVVLAVLSIYARNGVDAGGDVLLQSGLLEAVARQFK